MFVCIFIMQNSIDIQKSNQSLLNSTYVNDQMKSGVPLLEFFHCHSL